MRKYTCSELLLMARNTLGLIQTDDATGLSLDVTEVELDNIQKAATANCFDAMSAQDEFDAYILAIRPLIETGYRYSILAAKFLDLYNEQIAWNWLGKEMPLRTSEGHLEQCVWFARSYIQQGITFGHLDPKCFKQLLKDPELLKTLATMYFHTRTQYHTYLAAQTLHDRYYQHSSSDGVRYETHFTFMIRVVAGVTRKKRYRERYAEKFTDRFQILIDKLYSPSTPTKFNSGTMHPQLSSCYLTTVQDDLDEIYQTFRKNAQLSKFAGGIGNDFTPVRAMGALIRGTNGESQGVVPFLKVNESTAIAVNQGGKRKGAICAYLESWHADVLDFLELRKNTGDDRRRTHDMNTANWVPDLLIKRVQRNGTWSLFTPNEVPDLHELSGPAFEEAYLRYEEMGVRGELSVFKQIPAITLWRKMLSMVFETGHPWICFKDPCNMRSPQQHAGVVHSSNLCTEITLNTSADEIAVCNLGSINIAAHVVAGEKPTMDWHKLERTVKIATEMLNDVIDCNFYPVKEAKRSNLRHRPVGLGIMGNTDALTRLGVPLESQAAIDFAYVSQTFISANAIMTSAEIARDFGKYPSYEGSTWSQGKMPWDTHVEFLAYRKANGYPVPGQVLPTLTADDYFGISPAQIIMLKGRAAEFVEQYGLANSNLTSIAPTATISNILGVSQSIEPIYENLYVKSNLSGEFTVINPHLEHWLRKNNMWTSEMIMNLKMSGGSVQVLVGMPAEIKALFRTAFEIDQSWTMRATAARQISIDQSQSYNLYVAKPNGPLLDKLYMLAFQLALKTTYYLRTLGATAAEKSTGTGGELNAVKVSTPQACSIDNPDCEACQ